MLRAMGRDEPVAQQVDRLAHLALDAGLDGLVCAATVKDGKLWWEKAGESD